MVARFYSTERSMTDDHLFKRVKQYKEHCQIVTEDLLSNIF